MGTKNWKEIYKEGSGFRYFLLCILITGLSYGTCPTVTSAFTSSFYGQKYFPMNYSITNFNLVFAACITAVSNTVENLQTHVGGLIEVFRPARDYAVICNEEGKIRGLPVNCPFT